MQKNWGRIAELGNLYVRFAIVAARRPDVLSQLRTRFPECFTDTFGDGIVPDSLRQDVMQVMRAKDGESAEAYDRRISRYFGPIREECREAVAA